MSGNFDRTRRELLGAAVLGVALAPVADLSANAEDSATNRSGESVGVSLPSFASLKRIDTGELEVAYVDEGPPHGKPVLLLHGWPYDIHSFVDVTALLARDGYRVIVPHLRGYGQTKFKSAATPRNGQQSALAADAIALLDALRLKQVIVGGFDWGARTANIMAALWPERCKALVSVSGYLIGSRDSNKAPLPPSAELQWWYQFYFATARGEAGYGKYTHEFARLIWQLASPQWKFSDAEFQRSAVSLDNPDQVAIAIHNYRWRLGLAPGEERYDAVESKLAALPDISVPTLTMEGDANGAPHPDPSVYAKKFTGKYQHRTIGGGVGHNLPQEAPDEFAQAIRDVDAFA